jgi:hypothetical protein
MASLAISAHRSVVEAIGSPDGETTSTLAPAR